MFLMVEIRPDVAFATSITNLFAKNLGHYHIEVVKIIFRYLKRIREQEIIYGSLYQEDFLVKSYLDFDWAGNKES